MLANNKDYSSAVPQTFSLQPSNWTEPRLLSSRLKSLSDCGILGDSRIILISQAGKGSLCNLVIWKKKLKNKLWQAVTSDYPSCGRCWKKGGVAKASLEDPKIGASEPNRAWSREQGALLCDSLRSKLCHWVGLKPTRSFMVFSGLPGVFSYTFSFEQFLKAVVSKLNLKQTKRCF